MPASASAYTFVCGADEYLVDARASAEFARLSEGVTDDFSKEIINGNALNLDEVNDVISRFLSAVQTVALFGERKAVWLKGVTFLGTSRTGDSEGAKAEVARLAEALKGVDAASVGVLISACPVDQRKAGFKALKAGGNFVEISEADAAPQTLLGNIAAECGVAFEGVAADYLFQKLHGNMRLCVMETRKLALSIAGESDAHITAALIDSLVPPFGESDFFEPVAAFYENNLPKTLEALKRYFFTRKESRPLLANFQTRNRVLIQMRALLDAGEARVNGSWLDKAVFASAKNRFDTLYDPADKTCVFHQNPFALGFYARDAARCRLRRLIDFQAEFRAAFEGIMRRPNEQESVLREMVIRCLGNAL